MRDKLRKRTWPGRRGALLRGFTVAAVVAATSLAGAASEPGPAGGGRAAAAGPAAERQQVTEPGTTTGRVTLSGTSATPDRRTVCRAGAEWLRVRFTMLRLRGSDSVTIAGAAAGSVTLTAQQWPGMAFYTRAVEGSCATITPHIADPRSKYTVDAFQSGSLPLAATPVTVAAAGDICGAACNRTSDVVQAMRPQAAIAAGDNVYDEGTLSEYTHKYGPRWGRFNRIMHPTPGNHEYRTKGAAGYFTYFDRHGVETGARGHGYYSFDVGEWHFVALNSNIAMGAGSPQETWLRKDLAANTKPCTAAYWHHPRFSIGSHGDNRAVAPLYNALYDARADIVVTGHDHAYERFAPAGVTGAPDAAGIRQFVIGTGGRGLLTGRSPSAAHGEVFNDDTFGVGKLTLTATGYTVTFVPVAGSTFTDRVSGACHRT